jgi:hypothetical protein
MEVPPMSRAAWLLAALAFLGVLPALPAEEKSAVQAALEHEIIGPKQTLTETVDYLQGRVPRMPEVTSQAAWQTEADRLRSAILKRVVYRGEAAQWRDARLGLEWQDTIQGGPGYRIRKLRYEALPGLWVPALLYEPEKLSGKVPVVLNVNGHDPKGKAAPYKQIRCINQAKRGMLALNVEWLEMGQLRTDSYHHGRMNQLDLCGTGGIAPFHLCMKRGLDVLLGLENADPERVAVTGLSGGGWQTIFISSLDTRVKLADPVAGYSALRSHLEHFKDLGDSEQAPCDLATLADYTHLTALMAPRALLLTYNDKDDCCFESGYALPPLVEAATPVFKLFGKEKLLRTHVNSDPGTHNYEKDNRQALYRMLGDVFYPGDTAYKADEIPSDGEVKTADQLTVKLPSPNANFNSLALELAKKLPVGPDLPSDKAAALKWQKDQRDKLGRLVLAKDYWVRAAKVGSDKKDGLRVTYWRLKLGEGMVAGVWTVPAVELERGEPKGTTILVADAGRRASATQVERPLRADQRVLAVDPFAFGESKLAERDYLFPLLMSSLGDRPLGVQAGQVAAVARWAGDELKRGPVTVASVGPRSSAIVLVAAGLEERAIAGAELSGSLGSLKELIEENKTVEQMPELFCFGLLEALDIKQIAAVCAPRPVRFPEPSPRVRKEVAGLKDWYAMLGSKFDPLAGLPPGE